MDGTLQSEEGGEWSTPQEHAYEHAQSDAQETPTSARGRSRQRCARLAHTGMSAPNRNGIRALWELALSHVPKPPKLERGLVLAYSKAEEHFLHRASRGRRTKPSPTPMVISSLGQPRTYLPTSTSKYGV
jgi:hypothetical protein